MGNKKTTNGNTHQTQSFGQMVSKAALTQLLPNIEQMVSNLGSRLATQQARTYELVFSRILVLEKIVMEKFKITEVDLANKFADVEDERSKLIKVEEITSGDTVRLEIKTKPTTDLEYHGETRLKIQNIGTGANLGTELETATLGMKTGETKEVVFGQNGENVASIFINRVSRPLNPPKKVEIATKETLNEDTTSR